MLLVSLQRDMLKSQPLVPVNVILMGIRVFGDVNEVKVRSLGMRVDPHLMTGVLLRQGNLDTGTYREESLHPPCEDAERGVSRDKRHPESVVMRLKGKEPLGLPQPAEARKIQENSLP